MCADGCAQSISSVRSCDMYSALCMGLLLGGRGGRVGGEVGGVNAS